VGVLRQDLEAERRPRIEQTLAVDDIQSEAVVPKLRRIQQAAPRRALGRARLRQQPHRLSHVGGCELLAVGPVSVAAQQEWPADPRTCCQPLDEHGTVARPQLDVVPGLDQALEDQLDGLPFGIAKRHGRREILRQISDGNVETW